MDGRDKPGHDGLGGGLIRQSKLTVIFLIAASLQLAGCEAIVPIHEGDPEGPEVNCLDHGTLRVGDHVSLTALLHQHPALGQLKLADCGLVPGTTSFVGHVLLRADGFLAGECHDPRYLLTFSDGHRWKGIWMDNGQIVHLSNYPAHPLEF